MIKLRLPLKDISVTQNFGAQFYLPDGRKFYGDFVKGLISHNGTDFRAKHGCPTYATHDGKVKVVKDYYTDSKTGEQKYGLGVEIYDYNNGFKTLHYHLLKERVVDNQTVKAGDLIGFCDNTGWATTADHLHFHLKLIDKNGNTLDYNNGYHGCIDPTPYFYASYNGFEIGNKDWNKSRCYHRYYRTAKRNLANEIKTAAYLAKRLKRLPSNEEINAAIWGGWDIDAIMNDAMYEIYSQLKKSEYLNGDKPFN